jgi:hypothetical protein
MSRSKFRCMVVANLQSPQTLCGLDSPPSPDLPLRFSESGSNATKEQDFRISAESLRPSFGVNKESHEPSLLPMRREMSPAKHV